MSALQPDKPPLDAWYLVTPGGQSSVRITDGLTFTEEDTKKGRQLVLLPPCVEETAQDGVIRFQVDSSGVWLSVCHDGWQISAADGPVHGPIPIFHPVDLHFRRSMVHLRTDFSNVDCARAVELTVDRRHSRLSRGSLVSLQKRVNESHAQQQTHRKVPIPGGGHKPGPEAPLKDRSDLQAAISPLTEPALKKIPGKGRPSSLRLAPEPARRENIPLLTERVAVAVAQESGLTEKSAAPTEIPEPAASPIDRSTPRSEILVAEAPPYLARPRRHDRGNQPHSQVTRPQARSPIFGRLLVFLVTMLMVSIEVRIPDFLTSWVQDWLAGSGQPMETVKTDDPSRSARLSIPPAVHLPIEIIPTEDDSRELLTAIEALLEKERSPDAATLRFIADAYSVTNDAIDIRDRLITEHQAESANADDGHQSRAEQSEVAISSIMPAHKAATQQPPEPIPGSDAGS